MSLLSRRKLIAAAAGASGLAVAARLADQYGLTPPDSGGIYGPGNTLTYASQRLLTRHSLAREFAPADIAKAPFAKLRPFQIEAYSKSQAVGFADWRIGVDGMVAQPTSFSLPDLRNLPARTQINQLACEEGWSFIAEWTGVALSEVLKVAKVLPQARYVVYYSIQKNWVQSIDMADALHPQTLLAYGMNGADLPMGHGAPVRMWLPRQLGYKNVKFITRLTLTDSLKNLYKGGNYSWYAGI